MNKFILLITLAVFFSSSVQAAGLPAPSSVRGWQKVMDTPSGLTATTTNAHEVYSLLEHRGLLYIGYYTADLPNSKRSARLYTWDGKTEVLKYTFGTGLAFASVQALGEYKGNLYAGMSGLTAGDGDIYVSKDGGTTWSRSYNTTQEYFCSALVVFKDKLYGGMGYWGSRIVSFDGTTWKISYPGTSGVGLIEWMYVYKGKLYAAIGGSQAGKASLVVTEDGVNWAVDPGFMAAAANYVETASLVEFKGKLYAGMLKGGTTGGDVLVLDDTTGIWSVAWSNPNGNRVHSLEAYNGRLYVGNANMAGAGDVYVSDDGVTFVKDLDTDIREVFRLYKYNGSLYMGSGFTNNQAQIWRKNDSVALRAALKKLLEEESLYARNYILSALTDSQDAVSAEARWLKNQDDIAEAINAVYPAAVVQNLAILLRDHVALAKEIIQAVKTNNTAEVQAVQERWNTNADNITAFFVPLNNHWPADEIKDILCKHMQYILGQVTSRVQTDWIADVNSYDLDRFYMLKLADLLVDGIINQSPGN
jgi:hypothetical protein